MKCQAVYTSARAHSAHLRPAREHLDKRRQVFRANRLPREGSPQHRRLVKRLGLLSRHCHHDRRVDPAIEVIQTEKNCIRSMSVGATKAMIIERGSRWNEANATHHVRRSLTSSRPWHRGKNSKCRKGCAEGPPSSPMCHGTAASPTFRRRLRTIGRLAMTHNQSARKKIEDRVVLFR